MHLPSLRLSLRRAILAGLFLTLAGSGLARAEDSAAQLAAAVVKASGGENWPAVKRIEFTFQAEQPGKPEPLITAKHNWDVAANTDTVSWNGKTVTINLSAANNEGDAKAAFQRWTNDCYWLLAPLKLQDHGVHVVSGGEQTIDGKKYDVLNVSFDKVGLTNNDHYNVYVDPGTDLVARWDYMPAPDKMTKGTFENYVESGGLKLATEHTFGDKRVRILDLKVEK